MSDHDLFQNAVQHRKKGEMGIRVRYQKVCPVAVNHARCGVGELNAARIVRRACDHAFVDFLALFDMALAVVFARKWPLAARTLVQGEFEVCGVDMALNVGRFLARVVTTNVVAEVSWRGTPVLTIHMPLQTVGRLASH